MAWNASNLAVSRATLSLLLILLATTTATHPDGHTPTDDGGKEDGDHDDNISDCYNRYEKSISNSKLNISRIDTTKIDIDLINTVAARRDKTAKSIIDFPYNDLRNRWLTSIKLPPNWTEGIIYWMNRDQRVQDNWALLYAQKMAILKRVPLHVLHCTPNVTLKISLRQYKYMFQGLKKVESEFRNLNIQFHFLFGYPVDILLYFVKKYNIGGIVVDFLPLRDFMKYARRLSTIFKSRVPVVMVDAHNVIPCWATSQKLAHAPPLDQHELNAKLITFLTEFPPVIKHPFNSSEFTHKPISWEETDKILKVDRSVIPVSDSKAGYKEGILELENFMKYRLENYSRDSTNPMKNGLSNLSPWLHFGQISAQRVILEIVRFSNKFSVDATSFKNEILRRREFSDHFCFRHPMRYNRILGCRKWAKDTLNSHRNDTRKHLYTRPELEEARTHDNLWNAAQIQMMIEGNMHRFLRMYWAKKILEWTDTPENALATAIYLNDKYSLDGIDPNGYVGCMWAICGVNDRPKKKIIDRPIYGSVRYIGLAWYQSKFDTRAFIKKYQRYNYIVK